MYPSSFKNDTAEEIAYFSPGLFHVNHTRCAIACARIQHRAHSHLLSFRTDFRQAVKLNHRHVIHSLDLCTFTSWPAEMPFVNSYGSNTHAAPRLRGEMCEFVCFTISDGVSGTATPASGPGIDSSSSSCPGSFLCLLDFAWAEHWLLRQTARFGKHVRADLKHVTARQFHKDSFPSSHPERSCALSAPSCQPTRLASRFFSTSMFTPAAIPLMSKFTVFLPRLLVT